MIHRLLHTLGYFPVKVRRGIARGAWWSLYPHSAYWRQGGNDPTVDAIIRGYGSEEGAVCWDLGAHYGIYAIGMARAVGPLGQVEAFEPDPVSFRRLMWHRRLNRLPQLHVHPVAASAATEVAQLYQYGDFGATTSHLPYPNETVQHVASRPVHCVRLDEWWEIERLGSPSFVKIDIEGHATQALQGMTKMIAACRPVILLAVHDPNEAAGAVEQLAPQGYSLSPAEPAGAEKLARDNFGELLCLPPADR